MWTTAVFIFCLLFGIALIANVQLAGEGSWYWYAHLARTGTKLYSGLHLSLQPLFVLETEFFQALLGNSWIASKVPAVLHLLAFALGMFLLANKSQWTDREKAVVLGSAFFIGIHFEAYRFDDYHALQDVFFLYTIVLLLQLSEQRSRRTQLVLVAVLGILSGFTVALRLNDGAALASFTALYIACNVKTLRAASVACFAASAALAVLVSVLATGDSLITWATFSLLHVAAIKGGGAQFITDPWNVLLSALSYVFTSGRTIILCFLATALCWSLLLTRFPRQQPRVATARIALGILVVVYCLYLLLPEFSKYTTVIAIHAVVTLVAFLGGALVIARAAQLPGLNSHKWNPRELLFLLPVFAIASGSLSSAGSFGDLTADTALLILIYPIVWRYPPAGWVRSSILTLLVLAGLSGAWFRFNDPASWISYTTPPLFADRTVVDHPAFGPMIIDKRLLDFITPICAVMNDGDPSPQLLSMPWAYANYYCDIPPWHGYVQTWFDTSSVPYIDGLISELRSAPPKWVLYQRQLNTLSFHEILFNQGKALPQRYLDDLIMDKIDDGEWRIVRREDFGEDSAWLLLRTQWIVARGQNLVENPTALHGLAAWRVSEDGPNWSHTASDGGSIVVSYNGSPAAERTLSHRIQDPPVGASIVRVKVGANNVDPTQPGYSVNVYDASTRTIVGSLGLSHDNSIKRLNGFVTTFSPSHAYELELQFDTRGTVSFSNITIAPKAAHNEARDTHGRVSTSSFTGWSASNIEPVWSATRSGGGRFVVKHDSADTSESTLSQNMQFSRAGPVTVQLQIGSDYLDVGAGYGYLVELYDVTSAAVAGSLGVPAIVSPMKAYSFTALVSKGHRYMLRLRYDAARGQVSFSHIKVEYGPKATDWSDDRSRL